MVQNKTKAALLGSDPFAKNILQNQPTLSHNTVAQKVFLPQNFLSTWEWGMALRVHPESILPLPIVLDNLILYILPAQGPTNLVNSSH